MTKKEALSGGHWHKAVVNVLKNAPTWTIAKLQDGAIGGKGYNFEEYHEDIEFGYALMIKRGR